MRPLPVEPVAGAPQLLLGLAMIRGAPTPVVDAGSVLGEPGSSPERFVTLRTRDRRVALAVEAVLGVATIPAASLSALPPLAGAASREAVSAIGASDAGLLFVLESARLVPEAVWVALAGRGASP
jgi:purine-binding chemotaxis protein CheW